MGTEVNEENEQESQSCQQGQKQLTGTQEVEEHNETGDDSTTLCQESQFFTCPNSALIPVNSRVTDPTFNSEDDLCEEEPRQKRVRRSTECTDASLDFGTA